MRSESEMRASSLAQELLKRADGLESGARNDRETGESIEQAVEDGDGYTPDEPTDVAHGLIFGADMAEETAALLRKAAAALASQGEQQWSADAESAARNYDRLRDAGATHEQALHSALADSLAARLPVGKEVPRAAATCDQYVIGDFGEPRKCAFKPAAGDTLCKRHRATAEKSGYCPGKAAAPPAQPQAPHPLTMRAGYDWSLRRVAEDDAANVDETFTAGVVPPQPQAPAAAVPEDQVQTLRIPAQPGLDPITVHIDNWGIGRGRATIACYADAWTCCWTAMGERTLLQFLTVLDPDYMAGNMLSHRKHTKADYAYALKIAAAVIEAAKIAAAPAPEGGSHG